MRWYSISVSQQTLNKLKKLKERVESVTGKKWSMNDIISALIREGGDKIGET